MLAAALCPCFHCIGCGKLLFLAVGVDLEPAGARFPEPDVAYTHRFTLVRAPCFPTHDGEALSWMGTRRVVVKETKDSEVMRGPPAGKVKS